MRQDSVLLCFGNKTYVTVTKTILVCITHQINTCLLVHLEDRNICTLYVHKIERQKTNKRQKTTLDTLFDYKQNVFL